ncbi:hypothetical protein Y032_0028g1686 [Ancylostoma ceylanicum]|uniref:BAR domain-containing protein n=1 Tax=Ancylostoma ceylanicum TaxID=53326 RepID=A0A016UTJ6_9BILA|nr:hypothetical protein Y032_0028g1686 [Ancylostoma ceylanicum]
MVKETKQEKQEKSPEKGAEKTEKVSESGEKKGEKKKSRFFDTITFRTARTATSTLSTKSSPSMNSQICPGFGATGKGVVQAPVPVESKRMQNVKRFFFRVKESIGLVEKTEVSKAFTMSLAHLDKYKLCLDTLAEAVCGVIQENPSYRKEDYKMEMAPPTNEEENELVSNCLNTLTGFEDYKNQKIQIESYQKLGTEHREYIRRARRSLHNIRTFIQYDYWVIGNHRTELDTLRREMDFAKSELKSAKDAQLIALKNQMYQLAVSAFEEKLKQVTTLLDELPKHKEMHIADLLEWLSCTKTYHERMAKILEECEKG